MSRVFQSAFNDRNILRRILLYVTSRVVEAPFGQRCYHRSIQIGAQYSPILRPYLGFQPSSCYFHMATISFFILHPPHYR